MVFVSLPPDFPLFIWESRKVLHPFSSPNWILHLKRILWKILPSARSFGPEFAPIYQGARFKWNYRDAPKSFLPASWGLFRLVQGGTMLCRSSYSGAMRIWLAPLAAG